MDKSKLKPKLSFPVRNRGHHDTKHKLMNPIGSLDNLDLDSVKEPNSKKPRLGEPPAEHIQILNQNQQQKILSNIFPHHQPGFPQEVNETSAIYKSMHVVMEEMNEIVGEAKFVVNALNRMAKSNESPGTSHPIASDSKKSNEKKVKSSISKDDKLEAGKRGLGQRRKLGSDFGNIDELQRASPRPLMSARRLIFGPEENEPMDYND